VLRTNLKTQVFQHFCFLGVSGSDMSFREVIMFWVKFINNFCAMPRSLRNSNPVLCVRASLSTTNLYSPTNKVPINKTVSVDSEHLPLLFFSGLLCAGRTKFTMGQILLVRPCSAELVLMPCVENGGKVKVGQVIFYRPIEISFTDTTHWSIPWMVMNSLFGYLMFMHIFETRKITTLYLKVDTTLPCYWITKIK